jgi:hypothetical protein
MQRVQRYLIALALLVLVLVVGCKAKEPATVSKLFFDPPEDGGVWQVLGVTPVYDGDGLEIAQIVVYVSSNAEPTATPIPTVTPSYTPIPTATATPTETPTPEPVTECQIPCPCAPFVQVIPNDGGANVFVSCDCLTPIPPPTQTPFYTRTPTATP